MSNRPRKANVGSWQILHLTEDSVFYGYPVFTNLLTGSRGVDVLYRVDKQALQSKFPGYARLTGIEMKFALYQGVSQAKCDLPDVQSKWKAELRDGVIVLEVHCQNRPTAYRAEMDSADGKLKRLTEIADSARFPRGQ